MKKWTKLIAFVLVITTLTGILLQASAANYTGDINGDGKITVLDAQLIAEANKGYRSLSEKQEKALGKSTLAEILNFVLGNQTENVGKEYFLDKIAIYTTNDLLAISKDLTASYILMEDLDLGGADWTPVVGFSGTFDGNGKTISNFTINTSMVDTHSTSVYNQGFFADTTYDAVINNLHLRNVTLNAADNANSIGFFAGSLRGDLTGCTVEGTLNDSRETYPSDVYTGVMAGKLTSGSEGSITGGSTLSISDEFGVHTTENLCANVKLNIVNDEINLLKNTKNKVGLTGYTYSASAVTGKWADTTYSSSLLSETIQARQKKVVDYMNAMATVKWRPAEDLHYIATNGTNQNYYKDGPTESDLSYYIGLPYNGHNGSLERFMSVMDSLGEDGVYTAKSGLGDCGWQESAIVTNYIRLYHKTATDGTITGLFQKTNTIPTEVITFDASTNALCYGAEGHTFTIGGSDNNENMYIADLAEIQYTAHLYTILDGKPVIASAPTVGTAYKLGMELSDGTFLFFNGAVKTVDNVPYLLISAELEEAQDVYLSSVSGGCHLFYETTGAWSETGFYLTMGNDCSGAVNWAWMQVSNVVTEDVPGHNTPYKGGVYVLTTNAMIPNDTNRIPKGIYQVGDWETSTKITAADGKVKWVSAPFDETKAAYQCTDETYSPEVLIRNGIDTILEAYAQTHKADGVVCYVSKWSSNVDDGGHARLVVADPVVIRNANGTIDANASYMLLTEQGVGFKDTFASHWNVNKIHTFFELTGKAVEGQITNSTKTYLPITIRALREDNIREVYLTQDPAGSITSPVSGGIYSYHHINSVTVTVTDAAGKVYYDHEAFTGISTNYNTYRGRNNSQKMEALHGATFAAAAKATGMVPGKTYYFTVDVLLSTGEIIHAVETPKAFTYTE